MAILEIHCAQPRALEPGDHSSPIGNLGVQPVGGFLHQAIELCVDADFPLANRRVDPHVPDAATLGFAGEVDVAAKPAPLDGALRLLGRVRVRERHLHGLERHGHDKQAQPMPAPCRGTRK